MNGTSLPQARPGSGVAVTSLPQPTSSGERYIALRARHRAAGLCLSLAIPACVLGLALLRFESFTPPPAATPLVVNLLPLASPPEPVSDRPLGPLRHAHRVTPPPPQHIPVQTQRVEPRLPIAETPSPPAPPATDPGPSAPTTTAPASEPAPPAPRPAGRDTSYEARLLAHIQKFRRYPATARRMGDQGVAYLRVQIGRDGHLLSVQLLRGSGTGALDRGALDTLKRAAPLPAVPAERAAPFEMIVPVEFYIE